LGSWGSWDPEIAEEKVVASFACCGCWEALDRPDTGEALGIKASQKNCYNVSVHKVNDSLVTPSPHLSVSLPSSLTLPIL